MNTLSSISQLRVKHDKMLIAFFILLLVNLSFESTSDLLNCKCLECDDDSTVGKLYNDTCYYISVNQKNIFYEIYKKNKKMSTLYKTI